MQFKAAGWNFEFVLILAPSLDKSGMTTTAWCHKAWIQPLVTACVCFGRE